MAPVFGGNDDHHRLIANVQRTDSVVRFDMVDAFTPGEALNEVLEDLLGLRMSGVVDALHSFAVVMVADDPDKGDEGSTISAAGGLFNGNRIEGSVNDGCANLCAHGGGSTSCKGWEHIELQTGTQRSVPIGGLAVKKKSGDFEDRGEGGT